MKHSESLDKLIPALIAAQGEFPAIRKDGYNPHFKSKFSTLKAVQEATRPVLEKHGLTITQFPSTVDDHPGLTTWLMHDSGQWMSDTTVLSMAKSDPQAQGGAITYLRRYAWSAVLGLVTDEDDDDGNMATLPKQAPKADPALKAKGELNRLVAAAKHAGKSKEDVESYFLKKYGKQLAASPDLIDALSETADWLTAQFVSKELSK